MITFCNNNFSCKFLTDDSDLKSFSGILCSTHIQPFREAFESCLSSPGTCIYGSSKLINQQEQYQHIKWEMVAETRPETGMAIYLVGHDIHEHPDTQKELERPGKTLQAIFDNADEVKFFVGPDYSIRFFNQKAYANAEKLHGRKMKVGDNILDYARDTENNADQVFLNDFDEAIRGNTVVREAEVKYKINQHLWFRSEYCPIYEDNLLVGVSVTVLEITESKKHEQNIKLQNDKLRKIAFIYSHQVRQPLTNIMGILSLVNTDTLNEDDKYLMHTLNLSAKQLDNVVRQIVLEAQHTEIEKEHFNSIYDANKF